MSRNAPQWGSADAKKRPTAGGTHGVLEQMRGRQQSEGSLSRQNETGLGSGAEMGESEGTTAFCGDNCMRARRE
jgi:hypothetical protein